MVDEHMIELATVAAAIEAQLPDCCKLTMDEVLKCARAAIIAVEAVRDQFAEDSDQGQIV